MFVNLVKLWRVWNFLVPIMKVRREYEREYSPRDICALDFLGILSDAKGCAKRTRSWIEL